MAVRAALLALCLGVAGALRAPVSMSIAVGDKFPQSFYVDAGDAIREEIGIPKDFFGFLGGRETYVVDKAGTVQMVFNGQLNPEKHVEAAKAAVAELGASSGGGGFEFKLPF